MTEFFKPKDQFQPVFKPDYGQRALDLFDPLPDRFDLSPLFPDISSPLGYSPTIMGQSFRRIEVAPLLGKPSLDASFPMNLLSLALVCDQQELQASFPDQEIATISPILDTFRQVMSVKDYPLTHALLGEFTPEEALAILKKTFNPEELSEQDQPTDEETIRLSLALAVATYIDTFNLHHPDLVLPANSSQQENLAYLERIAGPQLKDNKRIPDVKAQGLWMDFPFKMQACTRLMKMGLLEEDVRYYPLWNLFSIVSRVAYLIQQHRTVWISTAKLIDDSYGGIPFTKDYCPPYNPQVPPGVNYMQQLVSQFFDRFPQVLSSENNHHTSPLYKDIYTLKYFFLQVLPELLLLSLQEDQRAFCKVFPQDKQELSIANMIFDARPNHFSPDGPEIIFETAKNEYTPRGPKKTKSPVYYYPAYNVIFYEPGKRFTVSAFLRSFTEPTRNNGPFCQQLLDLFRDMGVVQGDIQFMVNNQGGVAFYTDFIPTKYGLVSELTPEIRWDLSQATILPFAQKSLFFELQRSLSLALEEEHGYGINPGEEKAKDVIQKGVDDKSEARMITIPYPNRPTWKTRAQIASQIQAMLAKGKKVANFL